MSKDIAAERFDTPVYVLHGVAYLPHYRNSSVYVGPGYPRQNPKYYSEEELLRVGANKGSALLWHRGTTGTISPGNL
jgi:hypothetical protein